MLVRMDSTTIKPWQAKLMNVALRPALGYLCGMREPFTYRRDALHFVREWGRPGDKTVEVMRISWDVCATGARAKSRAKLKARGNGLGGNRG